MRKVFAIAGLALLVLAACAKGQKPVPENMSLSPVDFGQLPGWNNDHPLEAVPAFIKSCSILTKKAPETALGAGGTVADWSTPCAELAMLPPQNDAAARAFFEHWFQPYKVSGAEGDDGLFTGYYEAELHGSLKRGKNYQTPLYELPDDLIKVDLGEFKQSLKGEKIVGKVEGNSLRPYDNRSEITSGSLNHRARPLLWVDDPIDAFFLEVQGSGRVRLTNGEVMHVGFEGANGRAYVSIGKAMADDGLIARPVTMQSIRDWLKVHPERREEIMNLNPSYVFFHQIEGEDGPIGAETVALTPERSMAVDPAFIPLGAPVWLDTEDAKGNALQRLMIAQDTGGAIKGAVRGDVFWGAGDAAASEAGSMQSRGHYYLLLPKSVNIDGNS